MATAEAQRALTESSDSWVEQQVPAPRRATRTRHVGWVAPTLYIAPAFFLYAIFVLWPMLQIGWLALQRWNGYGPQTFVGLMNFHALWNDPLFRTSLAHSVLWEVAAAVVPTLLGLGLALLVMQSSVRTLFLAALFFPALLPATAVAAVWVLVYTPLSGLLNSLLHAAGVGALAADWLGDPHLALGALFVAWLWSSVGVGTLVFWTGLRSIAREYVELALVEGAGPLWRFRHVIVPALRRAGVVVCLINTALAAQVFDLVFVTTGGGPGYATMLLPIDIYGRAFGGRTGEGAAAACIQVAMGLALAAMAFLLVRTSRDGLEAGAEDAALTRVRPHRSATALLVLALIVFFLPLGWLLVVSLEPGRAFALGAASIGADPRTWEWSNFSGMWSSGMAGALGSSLLLATGAIVLTLLLAPPAAFALTRLVRGRLAPGAAIGLLLAGLLQPTSILIIPLFSLLRGLRLLDSPWGVLLPEVARGLPFAILILWAFLSQVPREVLDAAAVDGASPFQQMARIALPMAQPALFAVAIWTFISSWNEYLLPTIVSQDGSLQTVPTLLATFIGKYDTQFGLLAAGSLLAIAPSLLMYLALRQSAAAGASRAGRRIT